MDMGRILRLVRAAPEPKGRGYPIKRDAEGKPARKRAFEMFDAGMRPAAVAGVVELSKRTAYRYFEDWKRLARGEEAKPDGRRWARNDTGLSEPVIVMVAAFLGIARNGAVRLLREQHGLRQLLLGVRPDPGENKAHSQQESRLRSALEIVVTMEEYHVPPEAVAQVLAALAKQQLEAGKIPKWV